MKVERMKRQILAILTGFWLVLALGSAIAVSLELPSFAQQEPDAPSASKSDAAPQANTATAPDPTDPGTEALFPHFKDSRFWLSGQANFIFQTHPPFHAAYSGKNSLGPNYDKATSRVMTLYTGIRFNA